MVKKRIDSIRGTFRKELKRVKATMKSGAGADDIYQPHLWYYNLLLFLTDQETPRETKSNIDEDDISASTMEEIDSQTNSLQSPQSISDLETMKRPSSSQSSTSSLPTASVRANRPCRSKADEVLEKVSRKLDSDDKFSVTGKNIANKLRELSGETALIAEKFI
ncbi:uncharacterized protein [Leptinotarsa decemlineata]|uniref:uncharacterized protein n=1 Tax=Leptinotarsa decemlineata TaxID=7539 RepID=UPI003D306EF0